MPPGDIEQIWTELRDMRRTYNIEIRNLREALNNHVSGVAADVSSVNERLAGIEATLEHVPNKEDIATLRGKVTHQTAAWEKAWELAKLPVAAAIGAAMPYIVAGIKALVK